MSGLATPPLLKSDREASIDSPQARSRLAPLGPDTLSVIRPLFLATGCRCAGLRLGGRARLGAGRRLLVGLRLLRLSVAPLLTFRHRRSPSRNCRAAGDNRSTDGVPAIETAPHSSLGAAASASSCRTGLRFTQAFQETRSMRHWWLAAHPRNQLISWIRPRMLSSTMTLPTRIIRGWSGILYAA
jgi:hypothetical protein